MEAEYTTIAVNHTPEIDPGDTIRFDLYWSGSGIPDKNRLYLNYNPALISDSDPGEIRMYVRMATNEKTGENHPVSGEEHKQLQKIDVPGTHIGLTETVFYPDSSEDPPEWFVPSRISERGHDHHAPVEVRINTEGTPPGDYTIPIILNYVTEGTLKQDRRNVDIHVTSWPERHRRALEIMGIIGAIATIGILIASMGAL